ncbi:MULTISPECIES: HdeD family acid-resistance protein [unclassified Chelatococcus]|uniref:HdeD family acid-resistance protein n=1 Tax=unclassified Chelatococcus TaxID=2638111 RepID=UPI001BCB559D|nr:MULTISPECIES: HdeD family acid-resistance protein [unclassified Chelatococcus]MBS7699101.1 HdeD family acid-resistance protein [Chelatococcus sp. YT9]MBX3554882.1 HdeD family acid-resistance protein [Chelatococcus sp.]
MTSGYAKGIQSRELGEGIRAKWVWFLCLGLLLVAGGALAIMLPVMSTIAASLVLGLVLACVGIVQIIQSFQVKGWVGFIWHLLIGVIQFIGGVLIYLNPLAGAIAITALIAIVFLVQGVSQLILAFRLRPQAGWGWLLTSGLIALLASAALLLKFPYTSVYTPGTIAGISLLFAGCAYLAIAFTARRIG